jgi:hypothetical protein
MNRMHLGSLFALGVALIFVSNVYADLTTGLVAHYTFEGNANDISGNGHNGTVFGAVLTSDRFGNPNSAYRFDGNDYISVPDSNTFPISSNPFSISSWVEFTSYSTDGGYYLMGQSDGGGNNNKWIFFLGNTGISFIHYPASGSHWIGLGSSDFQLNTWYHVAIRNDGSILTAFVNGSPIGTAPAGFIGDSSNPFFMGTAEGGHPGRVFIGLMDDVRIYSRSLTDSVKWEISLQSQFPALCG